MTVAPNPSVAIPCPNVTQMSAPSAIHIYLGGSFDPVHKSHLALITHVYQTLAVGNLSGADIKAYFMPTSRSPLKTNSSSAEHRLQMLAKAIEDLKSDSLSELLFTSTHSAAQFYSNLAISEHEIWQTPPTYTINTLAELRKQFPEVSLIFIIGADNVASLPQWQDGDKLTQFAHLWVVPRDALQSETDIKALLPRSLNSQVTANVEDLKNHTCGHIYIDPHSVAPLSSSAIRAAITEGKSDIAKSALPHSVYSYIMKNNLYHSY